jgi:hypothetical protein
MKSRFRFMPLLAVTFGLGIANASGPIAVYALIDKVVLEPSADKPDHIRISGVFITAGDRQHADVYSAPQRGVLYLTLPERNRDLALREWNDLKTIAGSHQVIGVGSSWFSSVRVRKSEEDAKSPDEYPMGNGLVKINADNPRAKLLLDFKDR